MEFLPTLNLWAKGDAIQGKFMIGFGLLLALCLFFIFKSQNTFFKGMLIPICIITLVCLGYGSFLTYSRPQHIKTTTELYQQNPKETLQKELTKAQTDAKNYGNLIPIWAILIVLTLVAYFIINNEYYKGLSIGFLCLFVGFLLIDSILHHRLKPYLQIVTHLTP